MSDETTNPTPSTASPAEAPGAPAGAAKPTSKRKPPTNTAGKPKGITSLTHSQKAEAVELWRQGKTTLAELAKRFKRRPETFSRMFKRMGIEKGSDTSAINATAAKVAAKVEEHEMSELEESLKKLSQVKKTHFIMADNLAKIAWSEIVRVRQLGIDVSKLRETMQTLKLAGEVIGNARKELFDILDWEELRKKKDLDDLPDLIVRELSQSEVEQLQEAVDEFEGMDAGEDPEPGLDDDLDEES